MNYRHKLLGVASAAFFIASSAFAQSSGNVTNHAFALGKGPGSTGYTSLLCTSAQLAVGQAAADPICRTLTGDVTLSAAGVTAIGASKVTNAMLNADVLSTAHTWGGQQTFVAPVLGAATATSINKTAITAPATGSTLTIADGKTLTVSNSLTLAGPDTQTFTFPTAGGTVATISATQTLTAKTMSGASNTFTNIPLATAVTGNLPLANIATGTQDTALGYWGSTAVSALAVGNCSNALTYSTTTHTFGCNTTAGTGTVTTSGSPTSGQIAQFSGSTVIGGFSPAPITNSLAANVALSATSTVFTDGPSIAQGTVGTWWVSGQVAIVDTAVAALPLCKLWDGTTVIASQAVGQSGAAGVRVVISLSGFLANPAGNLRISCANALANATASFMFNSSGIGKDSTISAHRIQ